MKNLIIVLFAALLSGCSIVGPGTRGIRVSLGQANPESLREGLYLWIPFVYGMSKMDVQIQKSEIEINAASKDMQDVITHFALNWHINPEKVVEVYKTIGNENNVLTNIITPAKQAEYEAIKAKQDAVAEVNRAEGQARAQNLLKLTLTPELLQLKALEKWNGQFPQVMGSGTLPFINLKMKGNE